MDELPLYILHGWAISERNEEKWRPFLAALEKRGVDSHFLRVPGLDSPSTETWDLGDFVKWLESETRAERNFCLLGHSFGGHLACRFAARYPKKVSKLILIASAGIRDKSLRAYLKRAIFWSLAKLGKLFIKGDFARKILYRLAREKDYFEAPLELRETMRNVIRNEVYGDLEKIKCPTLIIWGDNDKITPLRNARIFAGQIPNAALRVIKRARHGPQFSRTKETAGAIGDFLKP